MSDAATKRWADTWASAGKALEAMRRRDLQAMSDDDVRRAIADLFEDGNSHESARRVMSGLVEQQRLFARLRPPT